MSKKQPNIWADFDGLSTLEQQALLRRARRRKAAILAWDRRRARSCIDAADGTPASINAAVTAACACSGHFDSDRRLGALLYVLQNASAAVFWRVMLSEWRMCDATWAYLPALLAQTRRHGNARSYMPAEALAALRALPPRVSVYRGCSRHRVAGIAWTLDRAVAKGFARGHRLIPVSDPVVASATIARARILGRHPRAQRERGAAGPGRPTGHQSGELRYPRRYPEADHLKLSLCFYDVIFVFMP
ncbi:MAG: hypothetical protein ACM3OF_11535 [Gemmatimonas sp.]